MQNELPGLEVKHLSYARENQLLFDQLSFSIPQGNLFQIVGQNGVGKTTLLRILTGLLQADTADICWQGQSIYQDLETFHRQLFYLDHSIGIKSQLTVKENLLFDQRLKAVSRDTAETALQRFGIKHLANSLCAKISRGEKQKVALAKIQLSHAKLFILDEPLTALDQVSVKIVESVLMGVLNKQGTIILSSHRALLLPKAKTLTLKGAQHVFS